MSNRNYIGKAKEGNYGTLRVNIKMSDAEKFIREHKDEKYLTFYISKMQEVDNFGNSHTAYCLEQAAEQMPEKSEVSESVVITDAVDPKAEKPKGKKKKAATV